MSKKQNYNPNSAEHNDGWHNEDSCGEWEELDDNMREKKGIPRHREFYDWGQYEDFGSTGSFIHKLDEIPEEADVPPEALRAAFNGLVDTVNKLIDWHNSIEEFEYNKLKNKK